MTLVETISQYWLRIQGSLFPWLEEQLGGLTEKEHYLITTLDLIRIERFTVFSRSLYGRPPKERAVLPEPLLPKLYTICRQRVRYWIVWHVTRGCGVFVDGKRRVVYQANQHSREPLQSFLRASYRHVFIRH